MLHMGPGVHCDTGNWRCKTPWPRRGEAGSRAGTERTLLQRLQLLHGHGAQQGTAVLLIQRVRWHAAWHSLPQMARRQGSSTHDLRCMR